jgi:hypothetical protein
MYTLPDELHPFRLPVSNPALTSSAACGAAAPAAMKDAHRAALNDLFIWTSPIPILV